MFEFKNIKFDGKKVSIIKKSKLNAEELSVVHDEVEIMHKINHKNSILINDRTFVIPNHLVYIIATQVFDSKTIPTQSLNIEY